MKDLGRLTYRFLLLFRHVVGLLRRVISPSQGLYLHRIIQHRKTRTNIHALSGIRTHDPSNQPAKIHASDLTAQKKTPKIVGLYVRRGNIKSNNLKLRRKNGNYMTRNRKQKNIMNLTDNNLPDSYA
jgi:hypothetical protein